MKKTFTLLLIITGITTQGQLLNGSFEDDGNAPSMAYWQHECNAPMSFADAAPGSGLWCAQKEYGNTQGCFPSHLYQTIPDMGDGEIWTLTGWARIDSGLTTTLVGVQLGKKDVNSTISGSDWDATDATTWTFLSVTDTILLNPGDTGAVVLNAGLVGGPLFGYAFFDGIELIEGSINGIEGNAAPALSLYPSPADNELFIGNSGFGDRVDVYVYDLSGKLVHDHSGLAPRNRTTIQLDTSDLTTGTYLLQLIDGNQVWSARFYKK